MNNKIPNYENKKNLLFVFCLNVFVGLSCLTSCGDNDFESYSEELVIASEIVVKNDGSAYWVKRSGSTTWEMMHTQIANFNYERGYEYKVDLCVNEIKDSGLDQSSRKYSLLKIISKEKKNSEVPLFTTDISLIDSQDEIAFPNENRELVTLSNGMQIEKVDSLYIYQGDIVLDGRQVNFLFNNGYKTKSGIISNSIKYWPDHRIYYSFAPGFTLHQNVYNAIREWEINTSLRFIESTSSSDYIEFFHGDGNFSSLGRIGGKQQISLSKTESHTGTAIHEIGHAVGLVHEQCRNDRDNYVDIIWDNIIPEFKSQFELYPAGAIRDIGVFDFSSIMLYSSDAFAKIEGDTTMTTKDGYFFIGQRYYLSSSDIEGVRSIYGPPFHNMTTTVTVISENVSGLDDYYEYEENYVINIYSDLNYTRRTSLVYPRNIAYIEERHYCDGVGTKVQIYRNYRNVLVPAGVTSYDLGTVQNSEHYVMGNPYRIDKTTYHILN